MASIYASFLESPSTSLLAANASLHYITTTTTFTEPAAILKHLQSQQKLVTKKDEKVLSNIEGSNGLCVETETTLQFGAGGGAFLPGIDENLLDERVVTFPMVHVVSFNEAQKIQQIRLYWDQATLLKQVEAIGRTGRNWPIRDGQALVQAVKESVKAAGQAPTANGAATLALRGPNMAGHNKRDSVSATRDPHASLSLFAPRSTEEEPRRSFDGPTLKPRESAKPAPREYSELFAGDETAGSKARSPSPTKPEGTALKAGAGKQFGENRLFSEHEELNDREKSPERKKTYQGKYNHFTFGDGENAPQGDRPISGKSNNPNKNKSSFSFEDFATPPKVNEKQSARFDRHDIDESDPPDSPPKRPVVHAARPDAKTHFDLTDNSPADQKPLSNITNNAAQNRRGQDFDAHYSIQDASPTTKGENVRPGKHQNERDDLESHWNFSSPAPQNKQIYKTAGNGMGGRTGVNIFDNGPAPEKKIYKTAGNGMGGRSTRQWGIGDESDPEVDETNVRPSARSRRAQQEAGAEF